jgi:ubiquinone/menaquinone biosynthesis C-methylase UbiE
MRSLRRAYAAQASADEVSEHWSGPAHMVERIAGVLGTSSRDRVLDVGSGLGGPARRLARVVGCRVTGVDVVEDVVRAAHARPEPGVRYVVGEAGRLPIADRAFDQVWCLGTLAHVPRIDAFASECARVLLLGGRVAITEAFRAGGPPPRFGPTAPQPWRAVRIDEVADALLEAGFEDVAVLPWPGGTVADSPPSDPVLARDLAVGRLVTRLVVATCP